MTSTASEAGASLLFDWAPPRGEKIAIAAFLVGSALLHAFCFYLFQIVYPPAIAVLSPPARISLISPSSEEGRTLLRWVEAEDPALASATLRPDDGRTRALPHLEHVPSYLSEEPELKHAPPLDLSPPAPSSEPPGPVPTRRIPPVSAWPVVPTQFGLSDDLSSLGRPSMPPAKFNASSAEPPQAVRFRIGVAPEGEVRYCFPINSSGDPALDQQARQHLLRSRFPARAPNDGPLMWGVATVEWGNDVGRPRPASNAVAP